MQYIPITTRIMQPPQDDLYDLLDEYLLDVQENDVIVITSKIVSIHLGLCTQGEIGDKHALTKKHADACITTNEKGETSPLTIKHHALLYRAGVDGSNSGDYYTVLPDDPYNIAEEICVYIKKKHAVQNLGVIITDSIVLPFRKGVISISIGCAGFVPYRSHAKGATDLFGKFVVETSTNLADALSAGSSVVSGEADESVPVVIVRDIPHITFCDSVYPEDYLIDSKRDLYAPLLDKFFNT